LVWFGILTSFHSIRYNVNKNYPKIILTQVSTDLPFHNRKPIFERLEKQYHLLLQFICKPRISNDKKLNTVQNMFVVNTESWLQKLPTPYIGDQALPQKPII
jgi:hypothetical protein